MGIYKNALGQTRFPVRPFPTPQVPYLMDTYATGVLSAFSLRNLKSSYAGPAITVRRSYDNLETDIGFQGTELNTNALTSFVSAGNDLANQDIANWNSLSATASLVTNGLIANFDFANTLSYSGTGTTVNSLVGSITGTLNNVSYESSNGGNLYFSGTSSNITLSSNILSNANNFTISSWVYFDRGTIDNKLISWGNDSSSLSFGFTGSYYTETRQIQSATVSYTRFRINMCVGTQSMELDPQYTGQWVEVSATNQNGLVTMYANGSELLSVSGASFSLSSLPLIGSNTDGSKGFRGRISKLKIYDRALTNAEIYQNFRAETGLFTEDHDATSFITAAGLTNSVHKNAVHRLVRDLKINKIWEKLWVCYPFVGGTEQAHKLNLKDPRNTNDAFRIQFSAGWTHSSTGALPNGTSAWANTNFNPVTYSSVFSTNIMKRNHMYYYTSTTTSSTTGVEIGHRSSNTYSWYFQVNNANTVKYMEAYDVNAYGGGVRSFSSGGGYGGFLVSRYAYINWVAAYQQYGLLMYKNGQYMAWLGSHEDARGYFTPINLPVYIGAINNQGTAQNFSNKEAQFISIGDSIEDDAYRYDTIVQTFQNSLGRAASPKVAIDNADSDIYNYLNQAQITSSTQSAAAQELIQSMKFEGIWNKTLAVYPMIGGNGFSHRINIKNTQFDVQFSGGWTHSSTGALPNGTTAYGHLGIIPAIHMPNKDRGHFGFYTRTNSDSTGYDLFARDASWRYRGVTYYYKRLNVNIATNNNAILDPKESTGFNFGMRGDISGYGSTRAWVMKNDTIDYEDGLNFGTQTQIAQAQDRDFIYMYLSGAGMGTGYGVQYLSNRELSFVTIGNYDMSELTALKYSRIVQRLQQRLGRAATITDLPYSTNSAFVKKWYDQSTAANHMQMCNKASQPAIYINGTVVRDANNKPALQFDGWNDALFTQKNINFQTVGGLVAIGSGTSSGIRTNANNTTILSTTVDCYLTTSISWTSPHPMDSYKMPIRPFGDNTYYTINNTQPYSYLTNTSAGVNFGGNQPTYTLLKDPNVNIVSGWGENGRPKAGTNLRVADFTGLGDFGLSYQYSAGSLFTGGYVLSGQNYMSRMKLQEIMLFSTTSMFNFNKVNIELNMNDYWSAFDYASLSDTDATKYAKLLRLGSTRAAAINKLVTDMKTAGLWTKMYAIYPFAGTSSYHHSLNLKDPNFDYYNGGKRIYFTSDSYGSQTMANTYPIMTQDGVKYGDNSGTAKGTLNYALTNFTANNFHSSFYVAAATMSGPSWNGYRAIPWRAYAGIGLEQSIYMSNSSLTFNKANTLSITHSTGVGYIITNSTTNNQIYRDGVLRGTSTIPAGSTMSAGGPVFGEGGVIYQSFSTFGYGLTSQEVADLNSIVQTYQQTLGRKLT
jgi:hypothetical protein